MAQRDPRLELLELAVERHTDIAVAEVLQVAVAVVHDWMLGKATIPDSAVLSLVDLVHSDRRAH